MNFIEGDTAKIEVSLETLAKHLWIAYMYIGSTLYSDSETAKTLRCLRNCITAAFVLSVAFA